MEVKFIGPQECPCCARWYTPKNKRQRTCARLHCQALRAKIIRELREPKPIDPRVALRRANLKAERRREAIRHEAEKIALGLYVGHLCAQPSNIDSCPFL